MTLNLSKTYAPSSGQVANSTSYNTDIAVLFNAFSGLEAQTSTLGALTITPSANGTTVFKITNAAGTELLSADTTNSYLKLQATARLYFDGGGDTYITEVSANQLQFKVGNNNTFNITAGHFYPNLAAGTGSDVVYNSGAAELLYVSSSLRYKKDIRDLECVLDRVLQLRPVRFKYKADEREDLGLIAEEVYTLFPEIVPLDKDGQPDSVSYSSLSKLLLKALQELTARVQVLETK